MSLIDEVAESGEAVEITKRGKPLVRIVPVTQGTEYPLGGEILCSPDELVGTRFDWPVSAIEH